MGQRRARAVALLTSIIVAPLQFLVVAVAKIGAQEVVLAFGLALFGYGLSLVYWPAAFIGPGAVLTAIAIFGVR